MEHKSYRIDWIRHGESCSNYNNNHIMDNPINGNDNFYNINPQNNQSDILTHSVDILTKFKSTFLLEPPLSYIGMNHAISLGTEYLVSKTNDDYYISSPLTRTISTALLALRGKNVKIIVVPFINEKSYAEYIIKGMAFGLYEPRFDMQNTSVPSNLLKNKIKFIKKWIDKNWFTYYDDIEFISDLKMLYKHVDISIQVDINNFLECRKKNYMSGTRLTDCGLIDKIKNIISYYKVNPTNVIIDNFISKYSKIIETEETLRKFKIGPEVDFSLYEEFEKNSNEVESGVFYKSNYKNFYELVLPRLLKQTLNNSVNITAFVHGLFIKELCNKRSDNKLSPNEINYLRKMMNTTVVREEHNKDTNKSIFSIAYYPIKLREKYGNFFDLNHPNLCDPTNNIMGIMNYELTNDSIYFKKYMKYKNKYVTLRKQSNIFNNILENRKM